MRNQKGFTLIELLAMITVLGILMVITIPNITGIINNSRLNVIKNDAKIMAEKAKVKVKTTSTLKKPKENHCLIFSLDYLNDNKDIESGPNGGKYSKYESFVIYTRTGQRYKYYIKLVEITSDGNYGLNVVDSEQLNKVQKQNVVEINNILGLTDNMEESKMKLDANKPQIGYGAQLGTTLCSSGVDAYYAVKKYFCQENNGYYFDDKGDPVSREVYDAICNT